MATFSTNQARQLYVAKVLPTDATPVENAGDIKVKADTVKSHLYFEYMGAGGQTRSDLIDIKSIAYAKATDADSLARPLSKVKLVLDSSVNSGNPVAGQDYILRIAFRNYIGLSEEDQYFKYGMVHAVTGMTASVFYKTLALSLVKNFSREEGGLLKFYLETGGTSATVAGTLVEVTKDTKESTLTGTYTGIVIEEKEQEWILGTFQQVPVNFTVQPDTITSDGDDRIWGVVNTITSTSKVENGKKIADLEYFCMGERGDMYRGVGFPNIIRTKYLVDPDVKYNVLDIHYSYQGNGEGVQKSEKDITLVVPKVGASNNISNKLINDIITKINSVAGLSIAELDATAPSGD